MIAFALIPLLLSPWQRAGHAPTYEQRAAFSGMCAKLYFRTRSEVLAALGEPDERWTTQPGKDPLRPFGIWTVQEAWVYGVQTPGGLPQLGRVYFDADGRAVDLMDGKPPDPLLRAVDPRELSTILDSLYEWPGLFSNLFGTERFSELCNAFIKLGKDKALDVLEEFYRLTYHDQAFYGGIVIRRHPTKDDRWESVYLLLRGIFDLDAPPNIWPLGFSDDDYKPLAKVDSHYPLVMCEGRPFLFLTLQLNWASGPRAGESVPDHLAYYRAHGRLRKPYLARMAALSLSSARKMVSLVYPQESTADREIEAQALVRESLR